MLQRRVSEDAIVHLAGRFAQLLGTLNGPTCVLTGSCLPATLRDISVVLSRVLCSSK